MPERLDLHRLARAFDRPDLQLEIGMGCRCHDRDPVPTIGKVRVAGRDDDVVGAAALGRPLAL